MSNETKHRVENKTCLVCKSKFKPSRSSRIYCSIKCYGKRPPIKKTCRQCGDYYQTKYPHQVYCSNACRAAVKRQQDLKDHMASDVVDETYVRNIMNRSATLTNVPITWKANAVQAFEYWLLHIATEEHLNEYRKQGVNIDFSLLQLINKVKLSACEQIKKTPCLVCSKPINNILNTKYCSNECYAKAIVKHRASKTCCHCSISKPLNEFYVFSKRNKDNSKRYQSFCISCAKKRRAEDTENSRLARVRKCPQCGVDHTRKGTAKYCSISCSDEAIRINKKLYWQRQIEARNIND